VSRTHFLRSIIIILYPVHHNYSRSTVIFHKWIAYVSWGCSYLTNLRHTSCHLIR